MLLKRDLLEDIKALQRRTPGGLAHFRKRCGCEHRLIGMPSHSKGVLPGLELLQRNTHSATAHDQNVPIFLQEVERLIDGGQGCAAGRLYEHAMVGDNA